MMAIPRVIPAIFAIWSASARVELRGLQPLPLDALLEEEVSWPHHDHDRHHNHEHEHHHDHNHDHHHGPAQGVAESSALPSPTSPTDLTDAECVDKPFPLEWQKYVKDCADAKAKGNCNRPGYVPYSRAYCPKTCGYCHATCADQPIPQTLTQYGPDCASAKAKGSCEAHPEYARVYCPVTCGMCPGEDALTESDEAFFAFDSDLASDMIDEDLASDMIDEDLASDMIDEDVASDMIDEVKGLFAADLEARPRCQQRRGEACGWWSGVYHHCCQPMVCHKRTRNPKDHRRICDRRRPHLGDDYLHEGEGDDYLYEGEGDDVFSIMDEMEVPNGEDE